MTSRCLPRKWRHLSMPALLISGIAPVAYLLLAVPAHAHSSEGGIVLLLPTGYYLAGAALAVAASFLLLAVMPARWTERLIIARQHLGKVRDLRHTSTSNFAFILLLIFVLAGFFGTRDPVENPLPSFIWTVWWVCFLFVQCIVGPLWPHLNPWTGPISLLRWVSGRRLGGKARFKIRPSLLYLIAIVQFAAFAWFELIDLSPADPQRLAIAVSVFWLFNLAGSLAIGHGMWMKRAEPFSIFFGLVGRLSPLDRHDTGRRRTRLSLVFPGLPLVVQRDPWPLVGVALILLTLSTVSFDGLSWTFVWLGAIGINPLEFPGRSAVMIPGTLGMIGVFVALSAAYAGAIALGCRMAGASGLTREAAGRLIFSIVPISVAFQAAHYLPVVLVDGQNFLIAISDPLSLGWNLFGTAHWRTTTSFLNTLDGVSLIFNTQAALVVLGHVIGIIMAHMIATRMFTNYRTAIISQIPLAALMVFYTGFGLWLLSTPRI